MIGMVTGMGKPSSTIKDVAKAKDIKHLIGAQSAVSILGICNTVWVSIP